MLGRNGCTLVLAAFERSLELRMTHFPVFNAPAGLLHVARELGDFAWLRILIVDKARRDAAARPDSNVELPLFNLVAHCYLLCALTVQCSRRRIIPSPNRASSAARLTSGVRQHVRLLRSRQFIAVTPTRALG